MRKQFLDIDWDLANDKGEMGTWERVSIALLMDIRRELKILNRLLACPNFLGIPHTLKRIATNTEKKKRARRQS
jgi:hypothetical protein